MLFPVFPTARAELIFHFADPFFVSGEGEALRPLASAALLGPRLNRHWQCAGPSIDWFLIQLTPQGCRRLLGLGFAETWEREVPLAHLWGGGAAILHERLRLATSFEDRAAVAIEALRSLPAAAADPEPMSVAGRLARAGRLRTLAQLQAMLDIGGRRLHQRFVADYGVGPKLFLSLMRFGRQLEDRHPLLGADQGFDPEYADDSHAIREFRRFAGLTPGAYTALKRKGDRLIFTGANILVDGADPAVRAEDGSLNPPSVSPHARHDCSTP